MTCSLASYVKTRAEKGLCPLLESGSGSLLKAFLEVKEPLTDCVLPLVRGSGEMEPAEKAIHGPCFVSRAA